MADGTLKVGTITTSSGSGTITIGQSGETVTIPSGCTVTNSGTATGFGFTNDEFFKSSHNGLFFAFLFSFKPKYFPFWSTIGSLGLDLIFIFL